MQLISKIIILFFMLIQSTKASDIVPIKKGNPSPVDGFVITKEFEQDIRQVNEDNKLLKRQNLLLKDLQVSQDDLVDIHRERVKNTQNELQKQQFKTVLYFIGGIILGAGVSYGMSKVYK